MVDIRTPCSAILTSKTDHLIIVNDDEASQIDGLWQVGQFLKGHPVPGAVHLVDVVAATTIDVAAGDYETDRGAESSTSFRDCI